MYQKEFENIITLICNKNTPERLIKHVISDSGLLKALISKTVGNSCFEFESGRKIQTGFFATLIEISNIICESENTHVKPEYDKEEKWSLFFELYVDPIKQRFKEGLLVPPMNQGLDFNSNFNNFESNSNQTGLGSGNQEKEYEIMTKLTINGLLKQLVEDYSLGKRADVIKNELEHNHKKEEMEILPEDDDDHYQYVHNDNIHQNLIHQYGSEKGHQENHEFYDNNYWAASVIVDELDLAELLGN